MKVTSASFLIGEARRIFARYQAPSENLADTNSPFLGEKLDGTVTAPWWCNENSRMSFSSEAIPTKIHCDQRANRILIKHHTFSVQNLNREAEQGSPHV